MAVERTFSVKMVGDAQQLIKEFNKVSKTAGGLFGKSGMGGTLSALIPSFKTVAIAGTAAFGAITAAAGLAVKAAAEDLESQQMLERQLIATTGATKSQVIETERQVAELSRVAAVADDELRPALATLVRGTGDLEQAQKLLQLATDISAGSGRDLASVSVALSRAANGSFTALTRLGIPLDEGAVKSKNLSAIVKQLESQFGGAAATSADTFAGKMRSLRIGIDELNEKVGELLLPYLEQFVGFLKDTLVPAVGLAIDKFKGTGSFSDAIAFLVGGLGNLGPAAINGLRIVGNAAIDTTQTLLRMYGVVAALVGGFRAIATRGRDLTGITTAAAGFASLLTSAGLGVAQDSFNRRLDELAKKADRAATIINAKANPAIVDANNRLEGFGGEVKRATELVEGLGDETEKTGGKADSAIKKLTRADKIKEYTKVLKDATSASDAFGRSQERAAKAKESLDDANVSLAAAEEQLRKAQQGGSAAEIADATRAVAAAQRAQARAGFSIEQSIIAVKDAEKRLAEVRADPDSTPEAIRLAEIALAEAKFEVVDAEDNQFRITSDLTEARRQLRIATEGLREGDEELLPLQVELARAQRDQATAAEEHTRAIKDQDDALKEYRVTLEELDKVARMFPRVAAEIGREGLLALPAGPSSGTNPAAISGGEMHMHFHVDSNIVNSQQVGQEIAEYLRDFTRVNGPLSNFVSV